MAQRALVKVLLGSVAGREDGGEEAKSGDESTARGALDAKLKQHAGVMLEHVLLPNMVWRVGGVAATIRYVARFAVRRRPAPVTSLTYAWLARL